MGTWQTGKACCMLVCFLFAVLKGTLKKEKLFVCHKISFIQVLPALYVLYVFLKFWHGHINCPQVYNIYFVDSKTNGK